MGKPTEEASVQFRLTTTDIKIRQSIQFGCFLFCKKRKDVKHMGGRGASSSLTGSANYKEAYNEEVNRGKRFNGDFALESYMTKEAMAYEMKVHKDVHGTSLIADLSKEVASLKKDLKENKEVGKSYGLDDATIKGIGDGIKVNIRRREQAIKTLMGTKAEYQEAVKQDNARQKRAQRMREKGIKWM